MRSLASADFAKSLGFLGSMSFTTSIHGCRVLFVSTIVAETTKTNESLLQIRVRKNGLMVDASFTSFCLLCKKKRSKDDESFDGYFLHVFFGLAVATSHRRLAGHDFSAHGFLNAVADVNALCLFCNKAIKKPYLESSLQHIHGF